MHGGPLKIAERFICLLLATIVSTSWADSQILHFHPRDSTDCVNEVEWGINGVAIGEPSTRADSLLGVADSTKQLRETDDGGEYTNFIRFYSGFTVQIVRGRVDRIVVNSSRVHLASGVAVGVSFDRVEKLMGRTPLKGLDDKTLSFPTCPHRIDSHGAEYGLNGWLILTFDDANVLKIIELLKLRP
jgi:hypothetical protein